MFTLPKLQFEANSMGSWVSEEAFSFHHGKHHAGYVTKLNSALKDHELSGKNLKEVISSSRNSDQSIFNLSAQHFNHSFFWNCLSPKTNMPSDNLAGKINNDFGSMDEFKQQFAKLALKHFGSGWIWLLQNTDGKLHIKDFHDADTPADSGDVPLLTLDVWEHAYYIDHRNNRAQFIDGFWDYINWEFVNDNLAS